MDIDFHNKIAELCLKQFRILPKTGKPKHNEWTILSCIVQENNSNFEVVSLGTGSKCIGKSKICPNGTILNDSHAEVMCRRSFLRYLYDQMIATDSIFVFSESISKFVLKEQIKFHFFTTHVPCGDAAIFPKQDLEEFGCALDDAEEVCYEDTIPGEKRKVVKIDKADIFRTGAKCLKQDEKQDLKQKGIHYHVLGVVRTKPGRGDPTLSVSCSDKISKWCHLGIQGALLSILIDKPIYLCTFTIAGKTPFCIKAFERAVFDRLVDIKMLPSYNQNKIKTSQVDMGFEYAKREGKQPCPSSISWIKTNRENEVSPLEVAVEGKKQGVTKKNTNTDAARLKICKQELFKRFIEIVKKYNIDLNCDVSVTKYKSVKDLAVDYQLAWKHLRESFKIWTKKDARVLEFYVK